MQPVSTHNGDVAHQPNQTEYKGATHDNSTLRGVGSHFIKFYRRYSPLFQLRTRDVKCIAEQYFKGLVQASKKNMERMAEAVPGSNDQALQHFLTNSPWDEQRVVEQVAQDANTLLGGRKNSCLNSVFLGLVML
jgi:DDE superfamily endonuclease